MDSKQESSPQKGKKRHRTELTETLQRSSEDLTPQKDSRTTLSTKKKARLSQVGGQTIRGLYNNRALVEVFKMCSPTTVLKSLSLVNRQWMETASSNEVSKELWNNFLEELDIPPDSSTHPKTTCAAHILQRQKVVDLQKGHVYVLNKVTGVWKRTALSKLIQVKDYSYTVLFDGSLIFCGGVICIDSVSKNMTEAYRVGLHGEVSALEPMITGRYYHGIVAYGRKVFVFGGLGGHRTIEMYNESSWSKLPTKLHENQFDFVPCVYKGLIYIHGWCSKQVEVFNPESLTVAILATITISNMNSSTFTGYEGNLVILGDTSVWKWNFERKDAEVISKPNYSNKGEVSRVVIYGSVLYVITTFTRYMIDMKTFELKYFEPHPNRRLTR